MRPVEYTMIIVLLITVLMLVSCGDKMRDGKTLKGQFDNLEKIFGIANWQVTGDADTSYMFFSRQSDFIYRIYTYRVIGGDTSDTQISEIVGRGDSVLWVSPDGNYFLMESGPAAADWRSGAEQYHVQKVNDSLIYSSMPGRQKITMKKTLPLSVFLTRVRFDYEHGTSLASDSGEVPPRKAIPIDSLIRK